MPLRISYSKAFTGGILAFASGVFFAISSFFMKYLKNINPGQLLVYQSFFVLSFSLPSLVKSTVNPLGPRKYRIFILLRCIFGGTGIYLASFACRYLPLGESAAIIFSNPVLVIILAKVFLKEPCGILQSVLSCITVLGIVLIAKIPQKLATTGSIHYTWDRTYGLLSAVGSLVFHSVGYIALRKIQSVHNSVVLLYYSSIPALGAVIFTFVSGGTFTWMECGLESYMVIVFGVVCYMGQLTLTLAMQSDFAGPVTTIRAGADIFSCFMFQTFLFGEISDAFSVLGAILIVGCVTIFGLTRWLGTLPENSVYRKKFRWLVP